MSVKPMQVVTKLGRSMVTEFKGPVTWVHVDCVTLADAERFAKESVEEAVALEKLRWEAIKQPLVWRDELLQQIAVYFAKHCAIDDRVAKLEEGVAALLYDSPRLELRVERLEKK